MFVSDGGRRTNNIDAAQPKTNIMRWGISDQKSTYC